MAITRGINHIGLTVPDMEEATRFFKEGLDGKIAYDSQTKTEEPRGGRHVEHILGLERGAQIIHKRMMVFGNGPNIEMFEFEDAHQRGAESLQDVGFTHIHSMWKRKTLTMLFNVFKRLEARLCLIHIAIHDMRILKVTKLFTLKHHGEV